MDSVGVPRCMLPVLRTSNGRSDNQALSVKLERSHYSANSRSNMKNKKPALFALSLLLLSLVSGCASVIESKAQLFATQFETAIRQSEDPVIVEQGLPAYLLLLDAALLSNPDQASLHAAASAMNAAYAGGFLADRKRAALMTEKAMNYAFRAMCLHENRLCEPRTMALEDLGRVVDSMPAKSAGSLYGLASAWAGWIQTHADDWTAVADLARVELLMKRVVALDPDYEKGMPQLYLGVLATILTPALGGRPEQGRAYFEEALQKSEGRNLMVKVYYARQYARGVFDRELHDRLLNEVLAANPRAAGFTLGNVLAQREAATLLASADDYF